MITLRHVNQTQLFELLVAKKLSLLFWSDPKSPHNAGQLSTLCECLRMAASLGRHFAAYQLNGRPSWFTSLVGVHPKCKPPTLFMVGERDILEVGRKGKLALLGWLATGGRNQPTMYNFAEN